MLYDRTLKYVQVSKDYLIEKFNSLKKLYYIRQVGKGNSKDIGSEVNPVIVTRYMNNEQMPAYRKDDYWYVSEDGKSYVRIDDTYLNYLYDIDGAGEVWMPEDMFDDILNKIDEPEKETSPESSIEK